MDALGEVRMTDLLESDHIVHFGIKGQKWGIRRFQNEDGTLTEEGKTRYGRQQEDSKKWKPEDARNLSDDELRKRLNRLQMEDNYKRLTQSTFKKETKDALKKIFWGSLVTVGITLMTAKYTDIIKSGEKALGTNSLSEAMKQQVSGIPGGLLKGGVAYNANNIPGSANYDRNRK